MKIARVLSLALCVVLLLFGCGANNTQTDNAPGKQAEIAQKSEPAETKDTEEATEKQNDTPFDWYAIKEKYPGPELPTSNVYVNRQCGYKLTVPESWLGWYFIEDADPECLEIYFYGKSIVGSIWTRYYSDIFDDKYKAYGQLMFFVMSEDALNSGTYDSIRKLGTINGTNYYSATATSVTVEILDDGYEAWADYEGEPELMKNDWKQAQKMDYRDIIFEPIQ